MESLFLYHTHGIMLISQLTGCPAPSPSTPPPPPQDVIETEGAFTVTIEVPGMDASDISINLHEGVLTVRGKHSGSQEGRTLWRERTTVTAFQRQFTVPRNVAADKVAAHLANGVLEVVLPKVAPPPKEAPINIPISTSELPPKAAAAAADDDNEAGGAGVDVAAEAKEESAAASEAAAEAEVDGVIADEPVDEEGEEEAKAAAAEGAGDEAGWTEVKADV